PLDVLRNDGVNGVRRLLLYACRVAALSRNSKRLTARVPCRLEVEHSIAADRNLARPSVMPVTHRPRLCPGGLNDEIQAAKIPGRNLAPVLTRCHQPHAFHPHPPCHE